MHVMDVRVSSRFNAFASPAGRLIRVHDASLRRQARPCARPDVISRFSDALQCRIIINALRREIDRLIRGIDRVGCCGHPPVHRADHQFDTAPTSNGGSRPRSPTALQLGMPLATINPTLSLGVVQVAPPHGVQTTSVVTNLGTRLDVLA